MNSWWMRDIEGWWCNECFDISTTEKTCPTCLSACETIALVECKKCGAPWPADDEDEFVSIHDCRN